MASVCVVLSRTVLQLFVGLTCESSYLKVIHRVDLSESISSL